ncbi:MAG TPA: hypothetical protein VN175_14085 [Rhizomicrobium sp.]|nr:hypothetical protein [Rhizomicrobium sp.]
MTSPFSAKSAYFDRVATGVWKKVIDFGKAKKSREEAARSVIGRQIEATLCPGMTLPPAFESLFRWIEKNGYFVDVQDRRIGILFSERLKKESWTDTGRRGGTDIEFAAEGDVNLRYWFQSENPEIMNRLCVFAKTGAEGSRAAFWLADDGSQKIVHLGSGSGSTTLCVLADDPVDFLRLLAIGYDEICWGQEFSAPPNASGEFVVEPNHAFAEWVSKTFEVDIPKRGSEIVKNHARMEDAEADDLFWRWVRKHVG